MMEKGKDLKVIKDLVEDVEMKMHEPCATRTMRTYWTVRRYDAASFRMVHVVDTHTVERNSTRNSTSNTDRN